MHEGDDRHGHRETECFPAVKSEIGCRRREIEVYMKGERGFLSTLEPNEVMLDAPAIVRLMENASARVGVGPMVAAAVVIAACTAQRMLSGRYAAFLCG